MKKLLVVILVLVLITTSREARALDLGAGYTCISKEVVFKGKFLKSSIVKSKVKGQISNQKAKISALKEKKSKNKDKIAAANALISEFKGVISNLSSCEKGFFSLIDYYNSIAGTYKGTYSASLGNFKLEGGVDVSVGIVGEDVSIILDYTGSLAEIVPNSRTVLNFSVKNKTFPSVENFTGTSLGDALLQVSERGNFKLTTTNIPNPSFSGGILTFDGKFSNLNKNFDGAFNVGTILLPGAVLLRGEIQFDKLN